MNRKLLIELSMLTQSHPKMTKSLRSTIRSRFYLRVIAQPKLGAAHKTLPILAILFGLIIGSPAVQPDDDVLGPPHPSAGPSQASAAPAKGIFDFHNNRILVKPKGSAFRSISLMRSA